MRVAGRAPTAGQLINRTTTVSNRTTLWSESTQGSELLSSPRPPLGVTGLRASLDKGCDSGVQDTWKVWLPSNVHLYRKLCPLPRNSQAP